MGIIKSYIEGEHTKLNTLKFGETSVGREPIIQKGIPTDIRQSGPTSNNITKRIDDLQRVATLFTQPPGIKYLANETALNALSIEPKQKGIKGKLEVLGNSVLGTLKTIGSTLAQVPLNGTGTHFVKGFQGVGKGTYLSNGLGTAPHTLVREGSDVYPTLNAQIGDGTSRPEIAVGVNLDTKGAVLPKTETQLETLGGNLINKDKRIPSADKSALSLKTTGTAYNPIYSKNKETRILYGDPALRSAEERKNYAAPVNSTTVDLINRLSIHNNEELKKSARDLIKFRFQVMTPEEEDNKYLHFRAYLDSFDDNFSADWNKHNYIGRAENFYTYQNFNRDISLGFKIAAQTRYEMRPLYRKIVYLASTTAPTYNDGLMRGTFVKLTVGDYLMNMPGIITSVNYSWDQNYPWEIALSNPEAGTGQTKVDEDMQELPMVLNCSINFTPIHKFAPETGLRHYITQPPGSGGTAKTPFFDTSGNIIKANEGLQGSVEVGEGKFGQFGTDG